MIVTCIALHSQGAAAYSTTPGADSMHHAVKPCMNSLSAQCPTESYISACHDYAMFVRARQVMEMPKSELTWERLVLRGWYSGLTKVVVGAVETALEVVLPCSGSWNAQAIPPVSPEL